MAVLYDIGKLLKKYSRRAGSMNLTFLLALCLMSLAVNLRGQQALEGTVRNESGEPVIGAVITLTNHLKDRNIAFAISAEKGSYRLQWAEQLDTLSLSVSHMGYARQEKKIAWPAGPVDWVLLEQAYELPEIKVEQPAIVRRGDTLIFDVNQLKEPSDENLEQILSRIPGITVEPNGQILYQDLPISKFYIEGLDLLEGSYALATRNLNVEAIRDIEILERHQPIRALDSLITPPNAAINLRLKSDIVFTGKARGGTGGSPALYVGEGTSFGFQKKQQFNILASGNNVGEQQRSNFHNLYDVHSQEIDLISPVRIMRPIEVPSPMALDNQEYTAGLNYLRRLTRYSQLKLQAYTAADHRRFTGAQLRVLRGSQQSVIFNNRLEARERICLLKGRLSYELNSPTHFTKVLVTAEGAGTNTDVDNVINQLPSTETFIEDTYQLKGRWENIWRNGNKAYRLWSKFNYKEKRMNLDLQPLDIVVEGEVPERLPKARQSALQRELESDTYTSFLMRRNTLSGQFKAGFVFRNKGLSSTLLSIQGNEPVSLGSAFENAINHTIWGPYHEQHYTWSKPDGTWKLHLPVALHQIYLLDRQQGFDQRSSFLLLEPQLEYIRDLTPSQKLTAQLTYQQGYDQGQQFYNNYLLRRNRQFDRRLFRVNRKREVELSFRVQGTDYASGFHYNSHLSLARTHRDWLTTAVFNSLGEASLLIGVDNIQHSARWQNLLEMARWPNFQLKLKTSYTLMRHPTRINAQPLTLTVQQAWVAPQLYYTFAKSVISCHIRTNYYHTNLVENPVWRQQFKWMFFHKIGDKGGDIRLSYDLYFTIIGYETVNNDLLSLVYKNQLTALNLDYKVHINNIFRAPHFVSFIQEGFSEELSYFQLRPRQLILEVAWKF